MTSSSCTDMSLQRGCMDALSLYILHELETENIENVLDLLELFVGPQSLSRGGLITEIKDVLEHSMEYSMITRIYIGRSFLLSLRSMPLKCALSLSKVMLPSILHSVKTTTVHDDVSVEYYSTNINIVMSMCYTIGGSIRNDRNLTDVIHMAIYAVLYRHDVISSAGVRLLGCLLGLVPEHSMEIIPQRSWREMIPVLEHFSNDLEQNDVIRELSSRILGMINDVV